MNGSNALAGCNAPAVACTTRRQPRSVVTASATAWTTSRERAGTRGAGLALATVATAMSLFAQIPAVLSNNAIVASVCIAVSVASLATARTLVGVHQRHADWQLTTGAGKPLAASDGVPTARNAGR